MSKSVFCGGDFSHWNNGLEIAQCEFFAQKVTESVSFVDDTALERVKKYANHKPCILYHVISPKTSVEEQFENFKRNWNKCHNYCGALGCAIDVEATENYFPFKTPYKELEKTIQFGELIEKELKRRPIIYCGDLYTKSFYKAIRNKDWLLWVARYASASKLKNICDMWQYTSDPYDKDYFFGNVKKLDSVLKDW